MKSGPLDPQGNVDYDGWDLVYDATLTVAAASVDITGLSGDTDEIYKIVIRAIDSSTISSAYLVLNSDTAANYMLQQMAGTNTTASANSGTSNTSIILCSVDTDGNESFCEAILFAKSGFPRMLQMMMPAEVSDSQVTSIYGIAQAWKNTADEITSMTIGATNDQFAAGTYIAVYRKAQA